MENRYVTGWNPVSKSFYIVLKVLADDGKLLDTQILLRDLTAEELGDLGQQITNVLEFAGSS